MLRVISLRVLLCLLLSLSTAYAAEDRAFFWKATSNSTEIHLLGSIHFANDSFYPLREVIDDAFDAADHLVLEVNLANFDPAAYMSLVNRYGRLEPGTSIDSLLSAATYQRLQSTLQRFGLASNSMDAVRPGMVVVDLSSLVMLRSGFSPDKGIDMVMMRRASEQGKTILALETIEQQLRLLAGLPEPELLLRETLDQIDNFELELRALETSWKQGDEQAIIDMMIEDPEESDAAYSEINEKLLYQRNRNMLKQLRQYLKTDKRYFVVVGAAHLLGEQGLIEMLKAAGYELERL